MADSHMLTIFWPSEKTYIPCTYFLLFLECQLQARSLFASPASCAVAGACPRSTVPSYDVLISPECLPVPTAPGQTPAGAITPSAGGTMQTIALSASGGLARWLVLLQRLIIIDRFQSISHSTSCTLLPTALITNRTKAPRQRRQQLDALTRTFPIRIPRRQHPPVRPAQCRRPTHRASSAAPAAGRRRFYVGVSVVPAVAATAGPPCSFVLVFSPAQVSDIAPYPLPPPPPPSLPPSPPNPPVHLSTVLAPSQHRSISRSRNFVSPTPPHHPHAAASASSFLSLLAAAEAGDRGGGGGGVVHAAGPGPARVAGRARPGAAAAVAAAAMGLQDVHDLT
jgi:hypothetical protein